LTSNIFLQIFFLFFFSSFFWQIWVKIDIFGYYKKSRFLTHFF
jgi:hypothetical protein